jgi:hypothetical protein
MNISKITKTLTLCAALLLLPACATAGPKSDSPSSIPVLLGIDAVRQDLNLTPVQCGLLDDLREQYKKQAKNLTQIGMADDDAALRSEWDLRSLRKQFNDRALAVLSTSQQDRLREIERQMLGGTILSSPSEQRLLGLSSQQRQSLSAISAADRAAVTSINAQYAAGRISEFRKGVLLRKNQESTAKQMEAVLTEKQRKDWLVLSGRKTGLPKIHDPNARTMSLFEGY